VPYQADSQYQLEEAGREQLESLLTALEAAGPWHASTLEDVIRTHTEKAGVKLGQVAQPLRAALTGRAASPGIFDVLELLGRAESLARIRDQADPQ
jgi:glutamyl-tRNA synthetase